MTPKPLIRGAFTHCVTKWGGVRALAGNIKAGLRGPPPPFDPPTSEAALKSPNSSQIFCPLSSLCSRGMLSAHYPTLPTHRRNGSKSGEVSFKSATPCDLHMTPVSSAELCFPTGSTGVSLSIRSNSAFHVIFSAGDIHCKLIYLYLLECNMRTHLCSKCTHMHTLTAVNTSQNWDRLIESNHLNVPHVCISRIPHFIHYIKTHKALNLIECVYNLFS